MVITARPATSLSVPSFYSDGTYRAGDSFLMYFKFSHQIAIRGRGSLTLNMGRQIRKVNLIGASHLDAFNSLAPYIICGHTNYATTLLFFHHTIITSDFSPDLDYQPSTIEGQTQDCAKLSSHLSMCPPLPCRWLCPYQACQGSFVNIEYICRCKHCRHDSSVIHHTSQHVLCWGWGVHHNEPFLMLSTGGLKLDLQCCPHIRVRISCHNILVLSRARRLFPSQSGLTQGWILYTSKTRSHLFNQLTAAFYLHQPSHWCLPRLFSARLQGA